jgi:2-alkyl-3-oxoalkanoate reductase
MGQALLLGAVNPVGCRLAEALCDRGLTAVALVEDWVQAPRLARLPVRLVEGRLADGEALGRAMAGCDAAFHCAEYDRPVERAPADGLRGVLTWAWRRMRSSADSAWAGPHRNLKRAEALLSAALRSGIRRVIWLNASGVSTASEKAALRCHRERGLSVTVLRPATLYGPFCPWTINAVVALRRGRRPRAGPAPCLYVDHLVEAMLLVAGTDAGAGEVFPLSDQEPASCQELLEAHARVIGNRAPVPATRDVGGGKPGIDADIQRARRVLGYNPQSGFADNMERTAAWIQWSRL